jgi:hypothetical protein
MSHQLVEEVAQCLALWKGRCRAVIARSEVTTTGYQIIHFMEQEFIPCTGVQTRRKRA